MKNFRRLDYNPFTLFIDTYSQPKSVNTHQHESALSYVLYRNTQPVLVDSGRISYAARDKYIDSSYHSGFSDPHWPVRPTPRFFFCKRLLMQEKINEHIADDRASFTACNRLLGIAKHLTCLAEKDSLHVTERLETKRTAVRGRLFHIFADCNVEKCLENALIHTPTRTRIIYQNAASVQMETIQRAIDYGKAVPCIRAIILPKDDANETIWSITHVH